MHRRQLARGVASLARRRPVSRLLEKTAFHGGLFVTRIRSGTTARAAQRPYCACAASRLKISASLPTILREQRRPPPPGQLLHCRNVPARRVLGLSIASNSLSIVVGCTRREPPSPSHSTSDRRSRLWQVACVSSLDRTRLPGPWRTSRADPRGGCVAPRESIDVKRRWGQRGRVR